MTNTLDLTLLNDDAATLCTPGVAAEFIQPWYTPIETTPANTGIAIGGIGSTYTMTASGTTPLINFLPGLHVEGAGKGDIRLQNWFASEREPDENAPLNLVDITKLRLYVTLFPIYRPDGSLWLTVEMSERDVQLSINEMADCLSLYDDNKKNFDLYKTEFSPKTQTVLKYGSSSKMATQLVLLDYFNGAVVTSTEWQSSLSGDLEEETIYGQNTYAREKIQNKLLYPYAELNYEDDSHDVKIEKLHFSPIVRNDEKSCASPLNFTEVKLTNTSPKVKILTLAWDQENLSGFSVIKKRPANQDASFILQKTVRYQENELCNIETENGLFQGITLGNKTGQESGDIKGSLTYGVLTQGDSDICVTRRSSYYSVERDEVVCEALQGGRVNNVFHNKAYSGREALSGILVVQVTLQAGESKTIPFVQILDFPGIDLGGYQSQKKYTSYFPKATRSQDLVKYGCDNFYTIRKRIDKDQKELFDTLLNSDVYKGKADSAAKLTTMAQNTLSFTADATVWDIDDKFLVRECSDYPFFNSLDVYFYGSFAMMWLLPQVDTNTMRCFKDAIMAANDELRRFYVYLELPNAKLPHPKYEGPRARKGAVIHDLGSPFDPQPDAYNWHNVAEWKDLAPKYILMLLRNYHFTKDLSLLEECWESVEAALRYLKDMILEGHSIPLTNGTDDTFDNLSSFGITIYCGSLWVAGLKAAGEIAKIINVAGGIEDFKELEIAASASLNKALWDKENKYFHFYSYPFVKHFFNNEEQLAATLRDKIELDPKDVLKSINDFVYTDEDSEQFLTAEVQSLLDAKGASLEGTKFRRNKMIRKAFIIATAKDSLADEVTAVLERECDDSFGDPLLADTYLEMMGLETVTTMAQRHGVLAKAYETNFKINSPHVGYANLVDQAGAPKEAFQAQDVWIGVQYSNASSLLLAGEYDKFDELIHTLYDNLYLKAKIPFAAPEGFNCSCTLTSADLEIFTGDVSKAQELYDRLIAKGWVLDDARIAPSFPGEVAEFVEVAKDFLAVDKMDEAFRFIQISGLKYTAGRYFRPGMVFALPMLIEQELSVNNLQCFGASGGGAPGPLEIVATQPACHVHSFADEVEAR